MVLRGTRSALWFDLVGDAYVGRFGTKYALTHDAMAGTFRLTAPNGRITLLNDFAGDNPGLFKSQITAGGQVLGGQAKGAGKRGRLPVPFNWPPL